MQLDGKVLVVGAGIGGLVLARALESYGFDSEVLERAPELLPLGAGIMVQTGAMLALRRLGLDEAVARAGQEISRGLIRTASGALLRATSLQFLRSELGVPSIAIHRARLHQVLLQALERSRVRTAAELVSFREDARGVTAVLADGGTIRGALLVGADGLHSAVRRQLVGDTPLRYAGYTSWRGVAPRAGYVPEHEATEIWGRGARFGVVPIGHGETYWFAVANAPEGGHDDDGRAAVLSSFAGWAAPVRAVVDATPADEVLRTDIHDRLPLPTWSRGRITLLGDAAHPATPNLGQGGGMAIEDAVVLAHCLSESESPQSAFRAYERRRLRRTTRIVKASWSFGKFAQAEGRLSTWLRNLAVRVAPARFVRKQMLRDAKLSLEDLPS